MLSFEDFVLTSLHWHHRLQLYRFNAFYHTNYSLSNDEECLKFSLRNEKLVSLDYLLCVFHSCAAAVLSKSELIRWSRDLMARISKCLTQRVNRKVGITKDYLYYKKKTVQTIVEWSWAVLVTIGRSRETLYSILSLWSLHQLSVVRWMEQSKFQTLLSFTPSLAFFVLLLVLTWQYRSTLLRVNISTHFNIWKSSEEFVCHYENRQKSYIASGYIRPVAWWNS